MTSIHDGAKPEYARLLSPGAVVLARGAWRTVSTISEASSGVHFRTDVGTDDERHFLTGRNTAWWVKDEESFGS